VLCDDLDGRGTLLATALRAAPLEIAGDLGVDRFLPNRSKRQTFE
jgi:hypothetical protein